MAAEYKSKTLAAFNWGYPTFKLTILSRSGHYTKSHANYHVINPRKWRPFWIFKRYFFCPCLISCTPMNIHIKCWIVPLSDWFLHSLYFLLIYALFCHHFEFWSRHIGYIWIVRLWYITYCFFRLSKQNWSLWQLKIWIWIVQMSFSVFQVAAILKSNMAAIRNIFQLGSHPKKIQCIFFIQGAKFHALFTKSTIFSPICPTKRQHTGQQIDVFVFVVTPNEITVITPSIISIDVYLSQKIASLDCTLFGAKSLTEQILTHCQVDQCETSVKYESLYTICLSRKWIWNCHL